MRSEAWRPAAAARNRSPREARDPARQALRPGCEELAARIRRQLPAVVGRRAPKETEARPRSPKPPRWSAERRASRVMGRKAPRNRIVNPSSHVAFLVDLARLSRPSHLKLDGQLGAQLGAFVHVFPRSS